MKLETSKWKPFRIGDYFEVTYGKFLGKDIVEDEYSNEKPFRHITTTDSNNGIGGYVSEAMYEGNCITVASDGNQGASFYQDEPYSTSNIVSSLIPKEKTPMSKYVGLFIATLTRQEGTKYSWAGWKFSVERVRETLLYLPAIMNSLPDWAKLATYLPTILQKMVPEVSI